jgi:hypothetical protein
MMVPPLLRSVLLLLALALVVAPPPADAQQAAYLEDFEIPNGYFFTQAAPGQQGAGYRVANEAGIPFWSEFQRHGGLATLGYPVSSRFVWKNDVVQLFQFGALRWRGGEERSDIVNPKDVGRPPAEARSAERPPRSAGDATMYPWSGWWWPANERVAGPRLFDASGPLAKYDRFVESLGRPDPKTMEWERSEILFANLTWAGHCNGWAAAALLEPEPTEARVVNGISFSVADLKGLLTAYHFADSALWAAGSEEQDVTPAEFHKLITSWMGGQRKGMVFTFRPGAAEEVWSYPAFKYESVAGPDPVQPKLWRVKTVVWLVDNDVPATFVGGRPWPSADGKVFEYTLIGDPHNPEGGEWAPETNARFGRPYMLWYPDPSRRNLERQLSSPGLDYALIERIVRGS